MIGGMDVGVFKEAGRRYDIRMRLEEEDRRDPAQIGNPLRALGEGRRRRAAQPGRHRNRRGASAITRTNRQRSVTIGANLQGRTLGRQSRTRSASRRIILPEGASIALSGQAQAMQEGARQLLLALASAC